jgi:hypothetical protein
MSEDHVAGPYAQRDINFIYQLLFCDAPDLFNVQPSEDRPSWKDILFAAQPDLNAVRALAEDPAQEARPRILAYNLLRRHSQAIAKKELLGVIIEVPLDAGLDVLAAYVDGSVRYINQTGKLVVFEGGPDNVVAQANRLLAASEVVMAKIGPWNQPRRPPPAQGSIRMTFLVSDGLYFGEGPLATMQRDPIGAPVVREAGALLQVVVDTALAAKK